jgi:hypothetical protein
MYTYIYIHIHTQTYIQIESLRKDMLQTIQGHNTAVSPKNTQNQASQGLSHTGSQNVHDKSTDTDITDRLRLRLSTLDVSARLREQDARLREMLAHTSTTGANPSKAPGHAPPRTASTLSSSSDSTSAGPHDSSSRASALSSHMPRTADTLNVSPDDGTSAGPNDQRAKVNNGADHPHSVADAWLDNVWETETHLAQALLNSVHANSRKIADLMHRKNAGCTRSSPVVKQAPTNAQSDEDAVSSAHHHHQHHHHAVKQAPCKEEEQDQSHLNSAWRHDLTGHDQPRTERLCGADKDRDDDLTSHDQPVAEPAKPPIGTERLCGADKDRELQWLRKQLQELRHARPVAPPARRAVPEHPRSTVSVSREGLFQNRDSTIKTSFNGYGGSVVRNGNNTDNNVGSMMMTISVGAAHAENWEDAIMPGARSTDHVISVGTHAAAPAAPLPEIREDVIMPGARSKGHVISVGTHAIVPFSRKQSDTGSSQNSCASSPRFGGKIAVVDVLVPVSRSRANNGGNSNKSDSDNHEYNQNNNNNHNYNNNNNCNNINNNNHNNNNSNRNDNANHNYNKTNTKNKKTAASLSLFGGLIAAAPTLLPVSKLRANGDHDDDHSGANSPLVGAKFSSALLPASRPREGVTYIESPAKKRINLDISGVHKSPAGCVPALHIYQPSTHTETHTLSHLHTQKHMHEDNPADIMGASHTHPHPVHTHTTTAQSPAQSKSSSREDSLTVTRTAHIQSTHTQSPSLHMYNKSSPRKVPLIYTDRKSPLHVSQEPAYVKIHSPAVKGVNCYATSHGAYVKIHSPAVINPIKPSPIKVALVHTNQSFIKAMSSRESEPEYSRHSHKFGAISRDVDLRRDVLYAGRLDNPNSPRLGGKIANFGADSPAAVNGKLPLDDLGASSPRGVTPVARERVRVRPHASYTSSLASLSFGY